MSDIVERKFGALALRIDRATCIANESCMSIAPEVFELDDDQICTFRNPAGDVERERLIEACQICPVDALIVLDEDGKEIVP